MAATTAKKYKLTSRLSSNRSSNTFRMTAMIDVIFLLLIFFLLTAKFRPVEDYLPLNIPKQPAKTGLKAEPLNIEIYQQKTSCIIKIADQTLEIKSPDQITRLGSTLKHVLNSQSRYLTDPIHIASGENVSWQYIAKIYDTIYSIGATDITFRITD